ncbi:MAG: type II toxin-antitoxin system VapC family toxin [Ignavibacteriales bacterium]
MSGKTKPRCILDSHAILAWLQGEAGGAVVADLFERARHGDTLLSMCVVNSGEVLCIIEREESVQAAQIAPATIDGLPVRQVNASRDITLQAAHYNAAYWMSYADCFGMALARQLGVGLVTGDPELRTQDEVTLLWIGP